MNFKELDSRIDFMWPNLLKQHLTKHGFQYVSECVYKCYVTGDKSSKEVGEMLEVSRRIIIDYVKRFGWKPKKSGHKLHPLVTDSKLQEKLAEMILKGCNQREMRYTFKCGYETLHKALEIVQ